MPFSSPTTATVPAFRQSATDVDNQLDALVSSVYAQDQITVTSQVQAVLGLRYERFGLDYRNNRDGESLSRVDDMVSPRAGLVIKPVEPVSFYAGYSMSHLPSSGDQFASLSATTQALEPERFTNVELGMKWDVRPELSLAAAAYRLDRTNTRAVDPADPSRSLQTGEQRTSGYEVSITGRPMSGWELAGAFSSQRATITHSTAAAPAGRTVPLVPASTVSMWNKVQLSGRIAAGAGVVYQGKSYAAIDNTVTLPSFARTDAALFVKLMDEMRLQLNVENVFDALYYATSHGNNNIMPGAPRSVRVSLVSGF